MHIGLNLILVIVLTARNNTYHKWNLFAQLNLVLVQIIAPENKQARNQIIASRNTVYGHEMGHPQQRVKSFLLNLLIDLRDFFDTCLLYQS